MFRFRIKKLRPAKLGFKTIGFVIVPNRTKKKKEKKSVELEHLARGLARETRMIKFLGDRKNPRISGPWQQPRSRTRSRRFNLGDDLVTIRRQRITDPESGVYTGYGMKRETVRLVEE